MLRFLELRLDNVVYRSGWGVTRPQSRQLVNHGHITVNGKRVDIPSYRVRKGDVVALSTKAKAMIVVTQNRDVLDRTPPPWLETGAEGAQVTVARAAAAGAHRRARPRAAHRRALQQVSPPRGAPTGPRRSERKRHAGHSATDRRARCRG